MLSALFHVLLWIVLCCMPAGILIPLRILDRRPSNEITHEQDPGDREDGTAGLRAAA